MSPLIALVAVAHLYDIATFLVCVRVFSIEAEWNPVFRAIYGSGGDVGAVAFKAAAVGLFILIAYLIGSLSGEKYRDIALWAFAATGLLGGLVNTASLLTIGSPR